MVPGGDGDGPPEGAGTDEIDDEEEEEEWTGDPKNRPIWKFPVVSRVRKSGIPPPRPRKRGGR